VNIRALLFGTFSYTKITKIYGINGTVEYVTYDKLQHVKYVTLISVT